MYCGDFAYIKPGSATIHYKGDICSNLQVGQWNGTSIQEHAAWYTFKTISPAFSLYMVAFSALDIL